MKIKINLHLHTSDDPEDIIDYDFRAAADRAIELGFGAIAITCHNKFVENPEYDSYASKRGLLLIHGIEKSVAGKHVVILNCGPDSELIKTFDDLASYREKHPGIFIIAPHPYFLTPYSLGRELDRHSSLFDAVEYSWFYSKRINLNKRAEDIAQKSNIPLLACSDTHFLEFLDRCYAIIETEDKTPAAIFKAIRERHYQNAALPSRLWKEMFYYFALGEIKKLLPRKKKV